MWKNVIREPGPKQGGEVNFTLIYAPSAKIAYHHSVDLGLRPNEWTYVRTGDAMRGYMGVDVHIIGRETDVPRDVLAAANFIEIFGGAVTRWPV